MVLRARQPGVPRVNHTSGVLECMLKHIPGCSSCSCPSGLPGSSRLRRTRYIGSVGTVLLFQCRRQQAARAADLGCEQYTEDTAGSSALSSSFCKKNKRVEHSELH